MKKQLALLLFLAIMSDVTAMKREKGEEAEEEYIPEYRRVRPKMEEVLLLNLLLRGDFYGASEVINSQQLSVIPARSIDELIKPETKDAIFNIAINEGHLHTLEILGKLNLMPPEYQQLYAQEGTQNLFNKYFDRLVGNQMMDWKYSQEQRNRDYAQILNLLQSDARQYLNLEEALRSVGENATGTSDHNIQKRYLDIMEALLQADANPNYKEYEYYRSVFSNLISTRLDAQREPILREMVKLMLRYGAKPTEEDIEILQERRFTYATKIRKILQDAIAQQKRTETAEALMELGE